MDLPTFFIPSMPAGKTAPEAVEPFNRLYDVARQAFALKQLSWQADDLWLALFDASYQPDTVADRTWTDADDAAALVRLGPLAGRLVATDGWCTMPAVAVQMMVTTLPIAQAVIFKPQSAPGAGDGVPVYLMAEIGGLPFRFEGVYFRMSFENDRVFRL